MNAEFLYRDVPALDRRLFRLGLATNFGITSSDLDWALDQGVNYLFWNPRDEQVNPALKAALKRDRESVIVAAGPRTGYTGSGIRKTCDRLLKVMDTDYLDVLQLQWLGRASAWTPSTVDALVSLKESGKVRAIGSSIHDRKRAGELAKDSPLDMLMVRYNAAHPGAEQDVFPHVAVRNPAVICYTATRWGALLKRPKGWQGQVMAASDCYRFCLSNSHVDVVLSGPKDRQQLEENISKIREQGPLSEEENRWMREYGKIVRQQSSRFTFSDNGLIP